MVMTHTSNPSESSRIGLDIPFVVIVPPHVPSWKREQLDEEGAVAIQVADVEPTTPWPVLGEEWYRDQFTKLRVFELLGYDQILYIDADMLLSRNLDDV